MTATFREYSRIEFIRLLRSNGYESSRHGKHEIFSDGKSTLPIPHDRRLSKMLTRRIIKELGLN
jgi:predicted RNA binding protein YcfA (HicA-like mRNA interferase family)